MSGTQVAGYPVGASERQHLRHCREAFTYSSSCREPGARPRHRSGRHPDPRGYGTTPGWRSELSASRYGSPSHLAADRDATAFRRAPSRSRCPASSTMPVRTSLCAQRAQYLCSHWVAASGLGPCKPSCLWSMGTSAEVGKSQYPIMASTWPSNW